MNPTWLYVAGLKLKTEALSEFLDASRSMPFKKLQDHCERITAFEQLQRVRRKPNTEDWLDAIR